MSLVARRSTVDALTPPVATLAVNARERGPVEDWHTVGAAGEPGYQSPWLKRPGEQVQFRVLPSGLVVMRGACDANGSATRNPVFLLPAGYRPATSLSLETFSEDSANYYQPVEASVRVAPDGLVRAHTSTGSFVSALPFDRVRFQRAG